MLIDNLNKEYKWTYASLGGATRVVIEKGEDLVHLPELDKKLWTVLSCPVEGLEFDHRTLQILDSDSDGKIRVDEVVSAVKWMTDAVCNPDDLLKEEDHFPLEGFDTSGETGRLLKESAQKVLSEAGRADAEEISINDIKAYIAGIDARCQAAKDEAAAKQALNAPYGDSSDAAVAALEAVRSKIDDYFLRCSLIGFDSDCAGLLDVSKDKIASIGVGDLTKCSDEIAACPIARPSGKSTLPLESGINPVWQQAFAKFKSEILDKEFPGATHLESSQWSAVKAKIDAYTAGKKAIEGISAETLDSSLAAEREFIAPLEKFIYLCKDIYKFLNNYVSLRNFYINEKRAMFQAGRLFIDQRSCELCIKVPDMSSHTDMPNLSGMFILYCDCRSKTKNEKMTIAAIMTRGDIGHLRVGKNAIFYDRDGNDWDATVVKIVDNPISIRQAMWSPYRKFGRWCSSQINKMASDKNDKMMSNLQSKADEAGKNIQTAAATPAKDGTAPKKQAFDIAKFCGIFAAIGMALGYIGSFLVSVAEGFLKLTWWQMPLTILAVMLVISGPSMIMAWSKLRKRNLGPVLNANGWAINACILIDVNFGSHLTHTASYPKLNIIDPYQIKKKSRKGLWWFIAIILILAAAAAALYFTGRLGFIGLTPGA